MKYFLHSFIFALLLLGIAGQAIIVTAAERQVNTRTGSGEREVNINTGSGETGRNSVTIENPIKANSVVELFQTIIDIVLIFAVPIIVFFIIYAGFLYVTARGNAGTIETAHKALLYALIGGLLILGARVLIEVIQGTVNAIIK